MHTALSDLELSSLLVIYPGSKAYSLADKVQVVPLASLAGSWASLAG
jgi:hypothetical protein